MEEIEMEEIDMDILDEEPQSLLSGQTKAEQSLLSGQTKAEQSMLSGQTKAEQSMLSGQTKGNDQYDDMYKISSSQHQLEALLEMVDKTASEWVVPIALEGELDLSFLENKKYDCLQSILFQIPGDITALHNVPKQLVVLHCSHQKLRTVDTFFIKPNTSLLEELYLHNNRLENVDTLSTLPHLALLKVDDNPLISLDSLPLSIEEVYVSQCKLQSLHFTPKYKRFFVLHINYNSHEVLLHHLPATIVDFQHESTHVELLNEPDTQHDKRQKKQSVDFSKALDEMFQMMSQLNQQNPKEPRRCVNCGQIGGTVFIRNQNRFYARCGNKTKPCNLQYELFMGHYANVSSLLEQYNDDVESIQEEIILLRLKSIFGLVNSGNMDEYSRALVKQYEETRQVRDKIAEEVKEQEPVDVTQLYEQEQVLKGMLQRYYSSVPRQPQWLTDAMEYQVNVVQPLIEKRRNLLYRTMYMEVGDETSKLWQYGPYNDIDEFNTAEPPRVIHYKK